MIYKIFISGLSILIFAVVVNYLAIQLGLMTWYGFFEEVGRIGFSEALKNQSIYSIIFMIFIYPLVLGFSGYLSFYVLRLV